MSEKDALLPSLGLASFPETQYAPLVAQTIADVKGSRLYEYVGDLSGEWPIEIAGEPYTLTTRYSYADEAIANAEAYALQHFQALGLPATCHSYLLDEVPRCNVVAEQTGQLAPERVVLLVAHLDSISTDSDPLELAPGADDNASGTAAVMATAVALRGHELPYTVRYVLTTGEEQGLYGSRAYARALAAAGENVVAVVNLDMIAFDGDDEPILNLHTREGDEGAVDTAIAQVFVDVIETYGLDLLPEIVPGNLEASDHAAFWSEGYPAIAASEDFGDFNLDHYHTDSDRLATLDIAYYTHFARAAAATVVHLAGVVGVRHSPVLVRPGEPVTLSAVSHLVTEPVTYTWHLGNGDLAYGTVVSYTFAPSLASTVGGYYPITVTVSQAEGQLAVAHRLPIRVSNLFLPLTMRPYETTSLSSESDGTSSVGRGKTVCRRRS